STTLPAAPRRRRSLPASTAGSRRPPFVPPPSWPPSTAWRSPSSAAASSRTACCSRALPPASRRRGCACSPPSPSRQTTVRSHTVRRRSRRPRWAGSALWQGLEHPAHGRRRGLGLTAVCEQPLLVEPFDQPHLREHIVDRAALEGRREGVVAKHPHQHRGELRVGLIDGDVLGQQARLVG